MAHSSIIGNFLPVHGRANIEPMINYQEFFRGKKITIMGLGLLGRGIGDAAFLAKWRAILTITDLKSEKELAPALRKLRRYKNITYHLGGHKLDDFRNRDFILRTANVPLDSPYLKEARQNGIPIEMSASWFVKLSSLKTIGVTGTRGKSTTAHLLHHILISWFATHARRGEERVRVWLGGNIRGVSTLALLAKVKKDDIAVLELDSWQLQGFGESRLSPQVAVLTNFMDDHLNYYKGERQRYWQDKANIFKHQTAEAYLIVGKQFKNPNAEFSIAHARAHVVWPTSWPRSWKLNLLGAHNRENASLAKTVAQVLGVDAASIKRAAATFTGVPGRLELIKTLKVKKIKIYNDTTSTTPDALLAALKALGSKRKVVLIAGGQDKGLPLDLLAKTMPRYVETLVLLPGSGTERFKAKLKQGKFKTILEVANLPQALGAAVPAAKPGQTILFSPGFASFGLFKNEFDRGDKFNRRINKFCS